MPATGSLAAGPLLGRCLLDCWITNWEADSAGPAREDVCAEPSRMTAKVAGRREFA